MDNMMRTTVRLSTKGLDLLDSEISKITLEAGRKSVDGIVDDIKSNWSAESPSSPSEPPAVVTGYLQDSIKKYRRDAQGRFAVLDNASTWVITVESEYGAALEFGRPEIRLKPRPYFKAAMTRGMKLYAYLLKSEFEFMAAKRLTGTKEQWLATGKIIRF